MPQKLNKLTNKKVGEPSRGSRTVNETTVHRPARGSHLANVVDHEAPHGSWILTRAVVWLVEVRFWYSASRSRIDRFLIRSQLNFSVRGKGIEVDETKVKAIRDLPTLKSVKRPMMVEWWNTLDISMDFVVYFKAYDQIGTMNDLSCEHSHVAQHVDDLIWRGCDNIWNNKYTLDGVVAHLPDKASQSVSEKAKLLQLHLFFEMVSKDDLWPKYFNTPEAIVDDIELFLFPSEARHQDKFDSMVQGIIGGEHALRALTPYGELLVFTSTELPLRHWIPKKIQTPENALAPRDVVIDRAPTEDDAQVMTDELGRGKSFRKTIARLDDYICL
ncbi:hypothetical protein MTR67_035168 [Solanum verrucosum]|uniref:AIPP2-like SPOC-like domain-containing protein n=1 Tax=Solanum verrucosum TaxID=315347 RepID=A0AAF0U916_SOLVR|nr:hypothetical protein MTR67_035168 [Solanum verrucosum]